MEKIIIVGLLATNLAFAQSGSKKISTGSKKGDALLKAIQEPAIKKDTLQESLLELKYTGKPSCYKDAPFMWRWFFYNTKTINKQWVTIIQLKPFNTSCVNSNHKANVFIASTQKGDTIRLINVCGSSLTATTKQILIAAQNAPVEDYNIMVDWGEEFNTDRSKTLYVIEEVYDNTILNTHYVTVLDQR